MNNFLENLEKQKSNYCSTFDHGRISMQRLLSVLHGLLKPPQKQVAAASRRERPGVTTSARHCLRMPTQSDIIAILNESLQIFVFFLLDEGISLT
jgi:hypothetical protein